MNILKACSVLLLIIGMASIAFGVFGLCTLKDDRTNYELSYVLEDGNVYYSDNFEVHISDYYKDIIEDQYMKDYPKETGFCLPFVEENNTLTINGFFKPFILYQSNTAVSFNCPLNTIQGHSHPAGKYKCGPSIDDLENTDTVIGLIACGDDNGIIQIILYDPSWAEYVR